MPRLGPLSMDTTKKQRVVGQRRQKADFTNAVKASSVSCQFTCDQFVVWFSSYIRKTGSGSGDGEEARLFRRTCARLNRNHNRKRQDQHTMYVCIGLVVLLPIRTCSPSMGPSRRKTMYEFYLHHGNHISRLWPIWSLCAPDVFCTNCWEFFPLKLYCKLSLYVNHHARVISGVF